MAHTLPRYSTPLLLTALLIAPLPHSQPAVAQPTDPGPLQLTVPEAIRRAQASSYALAAIDKRIADARSYAERSSAWLASNPFVSGGASASDSTFDQVTAIDNMGNPTDFRTERFGPSYSFSVQQDFEIAGQRGLRMQAAERGIEVVQHDRRNSEAAVEAEVKKAFAAALESDAKLGFAARSTRLFRDVNAAFDHEPDSDGARIALNSSTMQLQRRRRREDSARRARDEAYRQLKRLTGMPIEIQIEPVGSLVEQPLPIPPLPELLTGLADRRPDVAAYRALLARTDADLALAKRLAIPDVSLFGFVSRYDSGDSGTETSGGGSLGVSLPIFQGNGPSIDDAISERQRAAAELDDLIHLVEHNLASAYGTAQDAEADLRAIHTEILPRARENVQLQQRRADRGEVRSYDTVDYEIELLNAEEELVTAQRVYTDAVVELEKAAALPLLGAEWRSSAGAGAHPEEP